MVCVNQVQLRQIFTVNFPNICTPLHQAVIQSHIGLQEALWSSISTSPWPSLNSSLHWSRTIMALMCFFFFPDAQTAVFMFFPTNIYEFYRQKTSVRPPSLNNWIYRISFFSFLHMYLQHVFNSQQLPIAVQIQYQCYIMLSLDVVQDHIRVEVTLSPSSREREVQFAPSRCLRLLLRRASAIMRLDTQTVCCDRRRTLRLTRKGTSSKEKEVSSENC